MSSARTDGKPHEIVMPQLGLSMDSGLIIRWLKDTGDVVQQGEVLLEVESDKSIVEVEAVQSGQLQIVLGPDAGEVRVGEVIGYLLAEGQALVAVEAGLTGEDAAQFAEAQTAPTHPPAVELALPTRQVAVNGVRRLPSTPAARRRASELGIDWRLATPTGQRGQIREQDVLALAASLKVSPALAQPALPVGMKITPVARRVAEAANVDLTALAEAHPNQRIRRADVEGVLHEAIVTGQKPLQPAAAIAPTGVATQPAWTVDEIHNSLAARRELVTPLRRAVAERMSASVHTSAAVTLTTKADAGELVHLRNSIKAAGLYQPAPSYNVLLAALTARALVEHPLLNATLYGEEIIFWETVNVGVAVDTPRGLVVPVLRDAGAKTVQQLAQEGYDLLARAAAGKALPDELSGGTFTITNLGAEDILFFTPIINPPQCAVLGVGRLTREWVATDDERPVLRTMLPLSLSFDHRLVDGAPAARFLKQVKQFVEQPYLWLR